MVLVHDEGRGEDSLKEIAAPVQATQVRAGAKALSKFFFDEDYDDLSLEERRVLRGYAKAVLDAAGG